MVFAAFVQRCLCTLCVVTGGRAGGVHSLQSAGRDPGDLWCGRQRLRLRILRRRVCRREWARAQCRGHSCVNRPTCCATAARCVSMFRAGGGHTSLRTGVEVALLLRMYLSLSLPLSVRLRDALRSTASVARTYGQPAAPKPAPPAPAPAPEPAFAPLDDDDFTAGWDTPATVTAAPVAKATSRRGHSI